MLVRTAGVLALIAFQSITCSVILSTRDLELKLNETKDLFLSVTDADHSGVQLHFLVQNADIVEIHPSDVELIEGNNTFLVHAINAGHSEIDSSSSDRNRSAADIFLRVTVYKNSSLVVISMVIGWIYFIAWSISFYPQIYTNFKRKSVVGLNFDFLWLNIVGFTLYGTFNLGLYCIPEIRQEYADRYPRGLNPVQLNDIVFAVHAAIACVITIIQCRIYESGVQQVSITAKAILGFIGVSLIIYLILSATEVQHWLDFLYYCSYVKLAITLIKYIPQAYMNYKRKSTVGWSIGNIFLDFTGGMLSMLQMILNAHNYDDWVSIFGDPSKFGLGLFSVVFDIFFLVQHYVLYRNSTYEQS